MSARTVHFISLFRSSAGINGTTPATFRRWTAEIPAGEDPLTYKSPADKDGDLSGFGHPSYDGFLVEYDPEAPPHVRTTNGQPRP